MFQRTMDGMNSTQHASGVFGPGALALHNNPMMSMTNAHATSMSTRRSMNSALLVMAPPHKVKGQAKDAKAAGGNQSEAVPLPYAAASCGYGGALFPRLLGLVHSTMADASQSGLALNAGKQADGMERPEVGKGGGGGPVVFS